MNEMEVALQEMYELGVQHGRVLALKEQALNQLEEELKQLKEQVNE